MDSWHINFNSLPLWQRYSIITIFAGLLFFPLLGGVHLFDWDEINFAECAREMIVTKDYIRCQIDFMPFWEKPPVFIWFQALSMHVFGINDYAARFPNACIGVITLLTLYYAGRRVKNNSFALWWVLLYAASWLPQFYFKTGIIDPTFNYFIFLCLFQLHLLKWNDKKLLHAFLAGIFLGLAVLTKGPVAILIVAISGVIYAIINKGLKGYEPAQFVIVVICATLPFMIWMTVAAIQHGINYAQWFLTEFITYQVRLFTTEDADHGGPFSYHFIVLLLGCFPASIFYLNRGNRVATQVGNARDFTRLMNIMFWVVLILFSIVKTKIVHYSSLCYFPLTYLAAINVSQLTEGGVIKKVTYSILIFIGTLIAVVLIAVPILGLNKSILIPLIDDPFAVGNLQAKVNWSYWECLWGVAYLSLFWSAIWLMKRQFIRGFFLLLLTQVIIIQVVILNFTPKIEAYSQRAAISFFEQQQGQDVYIAALGYKSYAYLYYSRKRLFANKNYYNNGKVNEHWLMYGQTDKPTFFITKVQNAAQYEDFSQLEKIGASNGFVFFKRK